MRTPKVRQRNRVAAARSGGGAGEERDVGRVRIPGRPVLRAHEPRPDAFRRRRDGDLVADVDAAVRRREVRRPGDGGGHLALRVSRARDAGEPPALPGARIEPACCMRAARERGRLAAVLGAPHFVCGVMHAPPAAGRATARRSRAARRPAAAGPRAPVAATSWAPTGRPSARPVQRQRDRRLAGEVEGRGVRAEGRGAHEAAEGLVRRSS